MPFPFLHMIMPKDVGYIALVMPGCHYLHSKKFYKEKGNGGNVGNVLYGMAAFVVRCTHYRAREGMQEIRAI